MQPDNTGQPAKSSDEPNSAAELIRRKIADLYESEPNAKQEAAEVDQIQPKNQSKHQRFMEELTSSGKSLAQIQTDWHNYYVGLPDSEKHQVWQEFYAAHNQSTLAQPKPTQPTGNPFLSQPKEGKVVASTIHVPEPEPKRPRKTTATKSVADIKKQLLGNVEKRQKLQGKHHLQSLLFGFGLASLVLLILLFSFFNERFIAPLITPSKHVSSTPIIIDPNSTAASGPPEVIIPKINVQIPVVYDEPSIQDQAVETALERGVLHYATTPSPGEHGNVVVFGHSSNNIFNKGKYKFAFVLLSRLEAGDTFYLTKDGKRYAYRIYDKKIVKPTDVGVLGSAAKPDSATLITCDPPGTSLNRLVVTGEQISPDPNVNVASSAVKSNSQPKIVPGNAPSLWSRLTGWLSS
jgi:sortase A